jgi:hypothetical protein
MTLPASGTISVGNDTGDTTSISVNRELGKDSPWQQSASFNDIDFRRAANKLTNQSSIDMGSLRNRSYLKWTNQPSYFSAIASRGVGAAYGGSVWCVVGNTLKCATSPDGITWTEQTGIAGIWGANQTGAGGVVYGNGKFVAWGYDQNFRGVVATSTNGVSWTASSSAPSIYTSTFGIQKIIFNGSIFVVIGVGGKIASSSDGLSWTQRTTPGNNSYYSGDIVWTGSVYIYVALDINGVPKCATSTDLNSWTDRTSSSFNSIFDSSYQIPYLAWNGTTVCAAVQKKCATTTDGVTWTSRSGLSTAIDTQSAEPSGVGNIISAGTKFVASGITTGVFISSDGITWNYYSGIEDVVSGTVRKIAYNGSNLMAISSANCAMAILP